MRAILYDGERMQMARLPRPSVGPGTVLVRVKVSGICGTDLNELLDTNEPQAVPGGHEIAGEIVEIGPEVTGWSIGDRIVADLLGLGRCCGTCRYCLSGQPFHCLHRSPTWGGGFAELVSVTATACFKMPTGLSWPPGALAEPVAVSVHGLRKGGLAGGEMVVVLGAGTIGLTTVAAARALGAGTIYCTARYPHQAKLAVKLGADMVFSPESPDLAGMVGNATDGLRADLVVETVGGYSGETVPQAISLCRHLGRVILLGEFRRPVQMELAALERKELPVTVAMGYGSSNQRHDFEVALDILASHRLPLEELVTHTFPLERAQEAFTTARSRSTGSIKVHMLP